MANYWLCLLIQRVALPICLGISISFRPCGLSFLYLLLLLALPWVPIATVETMKKITGKFWKLLLVLVLLTAISHVVFHITLVSLPPYGEFLQSCNTLEYIIRQIGFVRLDALTAGETVRWVMPELLTLIGGVFLFLSVVKSSKQGPADASPLLPLDAEAAHDRGCGDVTTTAEMAAVSSVNNGDLDGSKKNDKMQRFLAQLGKYLLLALLCIAGSMRPSILNSMYFLTFLGSATWWACCRSLGRKFAISCRLILGPLLFVHLVVLYLYQLQIIQDLLPASSKWTRYFGITQLFTWDCQNPRLITLADVEWASFANPVVLYLLYYTMILETKVLLKPQVQSRTLRTRRKMNETTPLIRGVSPGRRYMKQTSTTHQDVITATTSEIPEENIQMQDMNETSEDDGTLLEQIILAIVSMFQVIIMSSYIFTNIIMMTWSITYHSWLTFILLLWANIVWIVPNQRRTMLRTSPLLVFYAQFLLLAQYIYGMDLTEEELPSVISGINMAQIGFERPKSLPFRPLIIKSLFTIMFWITLRQMMQERKQEKRKSTIADMVAPLQLTVGAATSPMPKEEPEMKSKFMQKAGNIIKNIMTKFWIWVVAIMLFVSGVTGQRMTVFRIIYMSLFLIFMLTFQISWKIWRKMMYGFWLTVIVFSMCILIMVYTYQFDNFPEYWQDYAKIPMKLQLDIGLERYQTRELFIKLVTPTFFVIISVIQLHYFHKDFLALSDMKRRTSSVGNRTQFSARSDASSAQGGPFSIYGSEPADVEEPTVKEHASVILERELSNDSLVIHKGIEKVKNIIKESYELMLQALELHMVKIIMFSIMIMCIYEVSAMHILFVALISLCQIFDSKWQVIVTKIISVVVSVLFILKMIYQIEYIEHNDYNVNCTDSNGEEHVYNTAKWIGFEKISPGITLSNLLHGYIGIIVVTTLNALIIIRQQYQRFLQGKPQTRPYYMFPGVTRADADKDVRHCLKYLANFGYYKFGLEISLIATVGVICVRLDAYAIFYGIWLLVLFGLKRKMASKIWPAYVIFIVVIIPLQYSMVVGFPPSLCIPLPWGDSDILRRTQEFMFLADPVNPPIVQKLICDFILLVLVCRQQLVFRIEKRYNGVEYPGGSNSNIVKHADEPFFVNPVPDYISDLRSWLDVVKRILFMSFLWISLAIVFLAGSLRVNIFSLGYLIGSFYFLWQGTDLLLRPIPMIIKGWNGLMAFNVSVIVCKAALQIVGCIFIKQVEVHACWAIQLLGIGCIQKFSPSSQFLDPTKCSIPREDIGLAWDGACFAFLILQRKIFKSYYFFHIINEAKAMTMLASRGAELKEELQRKRVAEQEDEEKNILEKIRQKMDRIKANQKRIQGPKFMEKQRKETSHCADVLFGFDSRPRYRKKEPKTYLEAIRSGDYYMFDEFDDIEIDLEQPKSSIDENEDEDDSLRRRLTVSEDDKNAEVEYIMPTKDNEGIERTLSTTYEPSELGASATERTTTKTIRRNLFRWLRFIWAFVESLMVSLTLRLHAFSRDYRYVVKVLAREKIVLKSKPDFGVGIRHGHSMIWTPLPHQTSSNRLTDDQVATTSDAKVDAQTETAGSSKDQDKKSTDDVVLQIAESVSGMGVDFHLDDYERADLSSMDKTPFIRLVLSLWYLFLSHTDFACYFMIFLHQIKSANILSLPLPLMVFFWGTLSVPRPSKTFWVTLIAYTQTIVLIKCMFQFEFMPWNSNLVVLPNTPFSPQKIIGIQKKQYYATYDLLLLLVVFFHRGMLKYLGLWNMKQPDEYLEAGEYQMDIESKKTGPGPSNFPKSKEPSKKSMAGDPSSPRVSKLHSAPGLVDIFKDQDKDTASDGDDSLKKSLQASYSGSNVVMVHNVRGDPCDKFPGVLIMTFKKYTDSVKSFFEVLLDPALRVTTNVYAAMFICDFYNFLVIIFGFSSFGQGNSSVVEYLEDNKVPIPFLVMIILQFMLILIDRALFLRKCIVGKVIFQYLLVLGVHIWMFFVLPAITERDFNASLLPQMWYMVKCFYLLLSAYQIRCGYPTRILGNFLCKKYNLVNRYLFQIYMLVPWLFELRTIMDWIWTDTSMSMFDWLKMEDIFSTIFQLKCARTFEEQFPVARGMKKKWAVKCLMGGGAVLLIVMIMWFPLVFFAIGNTVGSPNIPYEVTAELRIGSLEPVFRGVASRDDITQFNERQWQQLSNAYRRDRTAQTFLSNYEYRDASAVSFRSNSLTTWKVAPPDIKHLIHEINTNHTVRITLRYAIRHSVNSPMHPMIIEVEKFVLLMDPVQRQNLAGLLVGNSSKPVRIRQLFPKFLKVANKGTATNIVQLMTDPSTLHQPVTEAEDQSSKVTTEDEYESEMRNDEHGREYRDVLINLSAGSKEASSPKSNSTTDTLEIEEGTKWWSLREVCNTSETFYSKVLEMIPFANCSGYVMYFFNDKIFPAKLNFISGSGIAGIYVSMVFVAWRVSKNITSGGITKIIYDELPNVDRVLQLCLDIYLVRESGDFVLEEDLYAKIVFLFRSPETLIKWSRPMEEAADDDEDASSQRRSL